MLIEFISSANELYTAACSVSQKVTICSNKDEIFLLLPQINKKTAQQKKKVAIEGKLAKVANVPKVAKVPEIVN